MSCHCVATTVMAGNWLFLLFGCRGDGSLGTVLSVWICFQTTRIFSPLHILELNNDLKLIDSVLVIGPGHGGHTIPLPYPRGRLLTKNRYVE